MMKKFVVLDHQFSLNQYFTSPQAYQTHICYLISEAQRSKEMVIHGIQAKNKMNSKKEYFIEKLKHAIQTKEDKISKLQANSIEIDRKIQFYQRYLANLNRRASSMKASLDDWISKVLFLNCRQCQLVKIEEQTISKLSISQLLGLKCKFKPYIPNTLQISVTQNQNELQLRKTTDDPFYYFAYNDYPLPSKGHYHFSITVESQNAFQFLIGVSNCKKNIEAGNKHIYFNSQKMQVESNGVAIKKFSGQIQDKSKLTVLINSEKSYFVIILDQVFLCQANLSSLYNQYLYFFVAISSNKNTLRFDHYPD